MSDLYKLLKLKRTATRREVIAAYRRLALKHHPDRNPGDPKAAERMQQIQLAHDVLTDDARRAVYDATGEYSSSPRNMAEEEVVNMVGGLLKQALVHVAVEGGDARRWNLLTLMARLLGEQSAQMAEQRKGLRNVLARSEGAGGRFRQTREGERNLLAELAEGIRGQLRRELENVERIIALQAKVAAVLKDYAYGVEDWSASTTASTTTTFRSLPTSSRS